MAPGTVGLRHGMPLLPCSRGVHHTCRLSAHQEWWRLQIEQHADEDAFSAMLRFTWQQVCGPWLFAAPAQSSAVEHIRSSPAHPEAASSPRGHQRGTRPGRIVFLHCDESCGFFLRLSCPWVQVEGRVDVPFPCDPVVLRSILSCFLPMGAGGGHRGGVQRQGGRRPPAGGARAAAPDLCRRCAHQQLRCVEALRGRAHTRLAARSEACLTGLPTRGCRGRSGREPDRLVMCLS